MTTLNYPGTPGTMLYGGRPKEAPPGPVGVDTNINLTNTSSGALATTPVTFGFSFPAGAFDLAQNDLHASVEGTEIPMQMDCVSSHKDGSVRFAVLSLEAGTLSAAQTKTVRLQTGNKKTAYTGNLSTPTFGLVAEATIFGVQTTHVNIGLVGTYTLGQTITFTFLANGVTTEYVITVDASMGYPDGQGGTALEQYKMITAVGAAITAGGIYRARTEWSNDLLAIEPIADDFGAFTVTVTRSNAAAVTQTTIHNYAPPVLWTATMQDELASQVAQSNAGTIPQHKRRLHGPVVSEFRQMVKFKNPSNVEHDFLTAIFDVRAYSDGRKWVDLTMENTGLMAASPRTLHYSLNLKAAGASVFTQTRFGHYPRSRWHKQLWLGANAPQVRVTRGMDYFMSTCATPPLRTEHAVPEAEITGMVNAASNKIAAQAYRGPMAVRQAYQAMPDTGGRTDIGLISGFDTQYLLSQDDRARNIMLMASDNLGVFPVHCRDEASGWPVGLDTRPSIAVSGVNINVPTFSDKLPITEDKAHQPSAHYVPYLITGDAFYLDELMFWASWNLAMDNPDYRPAPGIGRLLIESGGLRQTAWPTRTVMQAVIALPDWHPRKAYYRNQLDANLTFMDQQVGVRWFTGFGYAHVRSPDYAYDCWHVDYVLATFAWMLQNGENIRGMMDKMAEFHFGQALHTEDGYCPQWQSKYYAVLGQPTTWAQAAQNVGGADFGNVCSWGALNPGGDYAASYRASAALCANEGVLFAAPAYDVFSAITPELDVPANNERRKWAFQRRI